MRAEDRAVEVGDLGRSPHGELPAAGVEVGHEPARLHGHRGLSMDREALAHDRIGLAQGGGDVAERHLPARHDVARGCPPGAAGSSAASGAAHGPRLVVHAHGVRGVLGGVAARGQHHRHRLAHEARHRRRDRRLQVRSEPVPVPIRTGMGGTTPTSAPVRQRTKPGTHARRSHRCRGWWRAREGSARWRRGACAPAHVVDVEPSPVSSRRSSRRLTLAPIMASPAPASAGPRRGRRRGKRRTASRRAAGRVPRPDRHHRPLPKHVHALREGGGGARVLLDEQDGQLPACASLLDGGGDDPDHRRGQAHGRLVEQISSGDRAMSARPNASICCSPPLSTPDGWFQHSRRGSERSVSLYAASDACTAARS